MKRYGTNGKLRLGKQTLATLSSAQLRRAGGGNNDDGGGSGATAECPSNWTCISCDWYIDDWGRWICR